MTSQVLCFQHHSTMRPKRLWQMFKCLEPSRASDSSMPHYPVRIPGLRDFSSGDTVPTSINPVSPLITGIHSTLPTRVKFTIFSKIILTHLLLTTFKPSLNYPKSPLNQSASTIFTTLSMATTNKLVSKRKFSSSSTPNRRFVSNMFWWTSFYNNNKKAVLPQGNRAMPQVFFSFEVRQQHSLQV